WTAYRLFAITPYGDSLLDLFWIDVLHNEMVRGRRWEEQTSAGQRHELANMISIRALSMLKLRRLSMLLPLGVLLLMQSPMGVGQPLPARKAPQPPLPPDPAPPESPRLPPGPRVRELGGKITSYFAGAQAKRIHLQLD